MDGNAHKEQSKSAWHDLGRLGLKLAIVSLLAYLALTFVYGALRLNGNNMYPALKDGDLCVTYRLDGYRSGDVVAYRTETGVRLGRIIARAGDRVDGDEMGLLLNGTYPTEEVFYPTEILGMGLELPYTVKDGEFIVLNDYRPDTDDSRTRGPIREDDLLGKVIFIFRRRGI